MKDKLIVRIPIIKLSINHAWLFVVPRIKDLEKVINFLLFIFNKKNFVEN
jgi:hypothetical protein